MSPLGSTLNIGDMTFRNQWQCWTVVQGRWATEALLRPFLHFQYLICYARLLSPIRDCRSLFLHFVFRRNFRLKQWYIHTFKDLSERAHDRKKVSRKYASKILKIKTLPRNSWWTSCGRSGGTCGEWCSLLRLYRRGYWKRLHKEIKSSNMKKIGILHWMSGKSTAILESDVVGRSVRESERLSTALRGSFKDGEGVLWASQCCGRAGTIW